MDKVTTRIQAVAVLVLAIGIAFAMACCGISILVRHSDAVATKEVGE